MTNLKASSGQIDQSGDFNFTGGFKVKDSPVVVSVSGIKNLVIPTVAGQSFSVTGFYSGTTVGGGEFIWDASKDKATHNGGTIIAPEAIAAWDGSQVNLSQLLSWTGTGSGCFVRVKNNALLSNESSDVMFGAVCDGTSNDFSSGQALLDSGASVVVFSENFNTFSQLTIPATVRLITSRNGRVKNSISEDNKSVFYGTGLSGITFRDINIQPPLINSTSSLFGAAICLWDCGNFIIDGVNVVARGNSVPEGCGIVLVRPSSANVSNVILTGAAYDADNTANTQDSSPQTISIWQGGADINVSNVLIRGGWGFGIRIQTDKDGDSPSAIKNVNVINSMIDGIHGHAYQIYTDDIAVVDRYTISDVNFDNCHFKNGTGKMYNSAILKRIYGIGFYNQGGRRVRFTNTSVLNSLQNTTTETANPIPSAAYASTCGGVEIVNGSAINTYNAPAININTQHEQIGIYDGKVKIVNFNASGNDNLGNDASMRFTQCEDLSLENVIVSRENNLSSCILIDSAGYGSPSEYTGRAVLDNIKASGGDFNIEIKDCGNFIMKSSKLVDAGKNALLLNNVASCNINVDILNHSRDVISSAVTTISGTGDAIGSGIRVIESSTATITSGSATGFALSVPFIARNNNLSGIANAYSSTYGESRTSSNTATPDVYGCKLLKSSSTTTTPITNFTGGVDGQTFTITQASGSRDIIDSSSIKTKTGATITLTATTAASFTLSAGVWYQL